MFFFVNQYLLSSNSSIEHAEIKRLKLFKEHQTAAKLVTRDFDNIIHATLGRFGLSDDQLVNMFDFFAGTTDYQGHNLHTKDLGLPIDYCNADFSLTNYNSPAVTPNVICFTIATFFTKT